MTEYEFKVEIWNDDLTEILDYYYLQGLGVKTASKHHDVSKKQFVVLVRNVHDWGHADQSYAYMKDDYTLPKEFRCAFGKYVAKVPKRFLT